MVACVCVCEFYMFLCKYDHVYDNFVDPIFYDGNLGRILSLTFICSLPVECTLIKVILRMKILQTIKIKNLCHSKITTHIRTVICKFTINV